MALVRAALLAVAALGLAAQLGFHEPLTAWRTVHAGQWLLLLAFSVVVWVGDFRGHAVIPGLERRPLEYGLQAAALLAGAVHLVRGGAVEGGWPGEAPWGDPWWGIFAAGLVGLLLIELSQLHLAIVRRLRRPGLLLPVSFLSFIAIGTALLMLPRAAAPGRAVTWIDSLFTITSAVCVTGLTVQDTATHFSPMGQAIIGLMIQLGGLGIIIFGTLLAALVGARLSLREHLNLRELLADQPLSRLASRVRLIVLSTLGLELAGACLLMGAWDPALPVTQRMALSLFHAVSAFCNAGFALFSDSFVGMRHHPAIHFVILPLIVIGGLGFPVLDDLARVGRDRVARLFRGRVANRRRLPLRLGLHTRLVIVMTLGLYLGGALVLLLSQVTPYANHFFGIGVTAHTEQRPLLDARHLGEMAADASFMSATARTAGFNTMPMSEIQPAGRVTLMALMFIGASPGGTGGGIKTTTLALLVLGVAAVVRQRQETEVFGRAIVDDLLRRAATLTVCFVAMLFIATLLLSFSEPFPFGMILFEVISAASTTGLSLGITSELTVFGKLVIIATMFLGRVGPLALLAALFFRQEPRAGYALAHEQVMIG